jgi:hypothetical protein
MRQYLRRHVAPLVPAEQVEPTVDLLRVAANGIVLSAIEHRDAWPAERQINTMRQFLDLLGL